MIKKIPNILKTDNNLLKFSSIIFIATILGGGINYFFQIYVGRALGPEGYGEFSALISLLYITSVPAGTISTTIVLFTSEFRANSEFGKIKYLLIYSIKKLLLFGIAGFILIWIASGVIASFLNIDSNIPILFIGLIFVISAVYPIVTGALQGLQKFIHAGINSILAAIVKLISGILLVYIGLGVNGAMLSLFISPLIAFLLALIPLRYILMEKSVKTPNMKILHYSLPVFITILIITLISNIDVMIVKHYFNANDAGYYSAASLISKIIFFVTGSIATVMLPNVSELHIKKENTLRILKNCLGYTFFLSTIAVFFYWVAPDFVVSLLFGREYAVATRIIGILGISMMFFSLSYMIIIYNIAIKNFRFIYMTTAILILEIILMSIFHENLYVVAKILAALFILLFAGLLIEVFGNPLKSTKKDI
ncbi:Polysaccharide biosynthesis protein [uncultured archaeon]|nr:Polysaccharide biosynthesis protein [uncultured archaeon]